MDLPKRVLPQGSPRRNPKATRPGAMGADENVTPKRFVAARAASPQRNKVLGERNGGGREAAWLPAPQPKPAPSPPSLTGRGAGTYDPKTNYTTPRPEFLRYNPERSREILLRLEREVEDDWSSATSGTEVSEAVSSGSSAGWADSESDDVDEEEVVPANRGRLARRLILLLMAVACSLCYICCMNYTPFPASFEENLNFVGPNGSMYGAVVHQVDSLLGPIDMLGWEDVLEAAIGQVVHGYSRDVVHLHGPGDSPRNFMAIAMMGIADFCPSVPFGEFTCQIGDESSENVDHLKEDSALGEQKPEVIAGSLENAEQSSEVVCSDGGFIGDSIGLTQSADMEEGKLGLVHQEEGEDYSNHSAPQSVSIEKIIESGSDELDGKNGFKSESLDQEAEPWEYENTAEAAKAISSIVKKLWSTMEPHLLEMLALMSAAGFVAAMFKCFQRSRKVPVPVSQHIPSVPLARVPLLAPHRIAQLPMLPSEQHVHLTVPKQEPSVSLDLPVRLPLPKPDPFISFNVPSIDHENRDQKNQQEDADNMRISNSNTMDHKEFDTLKPPVVELLGEYSFVDAGSSRGRSTKDSNRHGVDVTDKESLSLREDVAKMQKESSKIQSPSFRTTRKKENPAEVEKMDATPTPLRRSNRLRNMTSP